MRRDASEWTEFVPTHSGEGPSNRRKERGTSKVKGVRLRNRVFLVYEDVVNMRRYFAQNIELLRGGMRTFWRAGPYTGRRALRGDGTRFAAEEIR